MLSKDILTAVKSYTANMQSSITLVLERGEHAKREELEEFLHSLASVSENIRVEVRDSVEGLRSAMSFALEVDGKMSGIVFSGIPSGHEFNSLILAILHSSGTALKLDEGLRNIVSAVKSPMKFEVFVSLSCHNCPDVVQALNQFAILNENISSEMIDGGVFPELIAERDIQGVPSVYLNGELFANGKVETGGLIDKLLEKNPAALEELKSEALPLQDVVVVGGGPAGVAAAIYSARKGLKVTIVADRLGGQVKDTMGIENLISVAKTTGPELTGALQAHMNEYDITVKEHLRVREIEKGHIKKITLSSGEVISTKALIVATGAKWRELGVPGEKENIGNGVAYCPHCDGPFFKGKDVAVIGGGNSGIEAALDLAGIVRSVTVFEFLPELKADQVLVQQALARDNITIHKNVATKQILASDGKVSGIEYQSRETGELASVDLEGVFIQIGLVPNSTFVADLLERSQYGEIVVNERCETSEPGIFAAGDVTTVPYKQIVIAMGEGSKASLSAFEYLLMKHSETEAREESLSEA
ncbi:alkyl hydroperoxide reductase subunit F [Alteromonadaceae bacterium Bs31]|nr:alkyl hydroperoxide reductase subunit F [Alteromonadaceae bacterium Bs31]